MTQTKPAEIVVPHVPYDQRATYDHTPVPFGRYAVGEVPVLKTAAFGERRYVITEVHAHDPLHSHTCLIYAQRMNAVGGHSGRNYTFWPEVEAGKRD